MILEIAQIAVKPGMEAEFEAGVAKAKPLFARAKGCKSMTLRRGVEIPNRYRLLVEWETLENHTGGAWSRIVSRALRRSSMRHWRLRDSDAAENRQCDKFRYRR
jgi:heme-degrading monooxygenase HmoA